MVYVCVRCEELRVWWGQVRWRGGRETPGDVEPIRIWAFTLCGQESHGSISSSRVTPSDLYCKGYYLENILHEQRWKHGRKVWKQWHKPFQHSGSGGGVVLDTVLCPIPKTTLYPGAHDLTYNALPSFFHSGVGLFMAASWTTGRNLL